MGKQTLITPKKAGRPKKRRGRPPIITNEVLDKLLYAFSIGCTDTEACLYAGIAPASLYNYQDRNPKFMEQKAALKENPVLMARETVVKDIKSSVETAKWFLERKARHEFSVKVEQETNINLTFNNGVPRPKVIDGHAISSVPELKEAK